MILLLLPLELMAGWTGIAAYFGQQESDWLQLSSPHQASIDFYGLSIEEKADNDLRVGARAGQFYLRLIDRVDVTAAEKYSGQFFSVYLRLPLSLTDRVKWHTEVNYQLNLGLQSGAEDTSIDWTDVSLQSGLSLQLGRLSIRPFIRAHSIDGDITSDTTTRIFQQDDSVSEGIMLDYYTERSAYIRLIAMTGARQSLMMSFAREY